MTGGPVFVLGVERSGANLLAWSLGQHPAFVVDLPTRWLGSLGAELDRVFVEATTDERGHLSSNGVSRSQFHQAFGAVALGLVTGAANGSRPRLVDATPEHVFQVFALRRLFPDARFVHVVRDVSSVAGLLLDKELSKLFRTYHREHKVYEHWLASVRAGLAAEQALGSHTVLRVLHRDLLNDPKETVRRCLEFVGEDWHDGCLRVLDGVRADDAAPGPNVTVERLAHPFRDEAEALSRSLLEAPQPSYAPDPELIEELENAASVRPPGTPSPSDVQSLVGRVRRAMEATMPAGTHALVISRGDDRLLTLSERTAGHFPQADDGQYLGYHPADSADAIGRLEALRQRGARFLVIPSTAFWWLDHYREFQAHLERCYQVVVRQEDVCVIYSLGPEARAERDVHPPEAEDETPHLRLRQLEAELAALRQLTRTSEPTFSDAGGTSS